MLQAMLAGVASIRAQQTRMNVIGNNLANVNTTAFKSARVTFQDMLSQTQRGGTTPGENLGGTNPIQYGLGVIVSGTDVNSEQGSLSATNRPTDLAIQGPGFLMVSNGSRIGYTRDGAFNLDAEGDLVHRATGERLLGWTANSETGDIDLNQPVTTASKLNIPIGLRTAVQATTLVDWAGNLDARSSIGASTTTNVKVYDALGGEHEVLLTFAKTADNSWSWTATPGDPNDITVTGSGTVAFDPATGKMSSGATATISIQPLTGGAPAMQVTSNMESITQLSTEMLVQAAEQNGFPSGSLNSFNIGPDGVVTGLYSNGLTRPLARIAMANFTNAAGLERIGSNLWRGTDNSGNPTVTGAGSKGAGILNSGFLEQSNVDIGNEFSDLIITQRGFQANTRVVTTVDEMLQDLINMKR
jgi:flagellar hook protein FlgE